MNRFVASTLALALFAGCKSEKAPSEKLGEAAEDLVKDATAMVEDRQPKGRFAPRDECSELPGATSFLDKLSAVISARDADAFAALADPAIRLDFGGGSGAEELKKRLGDPDRALWDELDELDDLGCAPNGHGGLTIPSYFAKDMGEIDSYRAMIVTDEDVPLRAKPIEKSEALERLSWDVVELSGGLKPDQPFQQVETSSGNTGYVAASSLRSLLDYRLIAQPVDGEWRISAFVAGD